MGQRIVGSSTVDIGAAGLLVPGLVIDGKYRLAEEIGRGSFGTVFRAENLVGPAPVALKFLRSPAPVSLGRWQREIVALRTFDFPGVVRFLDEGIFSGIPYVAMGLIRGTPFPGAGREGSWDAIAPVATAFLEALARVHAQRIVHRDLKPSNVLVDESGIPSILDFGLSFVFDPGERFTVAGHWLGTPLYLAPEQHGGSVVDLRSDLFSAGVMLYEAIAGAPPFHGKTFPELLSDKMRGRAPRLDHLVPSVPERVAAAIHRMLEPEPNRRPPDAAAVLRALGGGPPSPSSTPWIGRRELLEAWRARIGAGKSLDISGRPGSGRSRALHELARFAKEAGRRVTWATAGHRAFASLAPFLPADGVRSDRPLDEVRAQVAEALHRYLADGGILFVDDGEEIDRWSAPLIDAARARGAVARAVAPAAAADFVLEPLGESELAELFHGPSVLFHLPEDAARELHLRTGGLPGLVFDELAAWERAGLCHREGERWRIPRESIDALSAGSRMFAGLRVSLNAADVRPELRDLLAWVELAFPFADADRLARSSDRPRWEIEADLAALAEDGAIRIAEDGACTPLITGVAAQIWEPAELRRAHRRLKDTLPAGTPARLYHIIADQSAEGGASDEVFEETMRVVDEWYRAGRHGEAIVALSQALRLARSAGDEARELQVLERWVVAAFCIGTRSFPAILAELARSRSAGDERLRMASLVHLHDRALRGGDPDLLAEIDSLPRFENPVLEAWRWATRVLAGRFVPPPRDGSDLDEMQALLHCEEGDEIQQNLDHWRGLFLYRRGEYSAAAECHLSTRSRCRHAVGRLKLGINAAYALMEDYQLERSRALALEVRDEASAARSAEIELRASDLCRRLEYRKGRNLAPEEDWIQLARDVDSPVVLAGVLLTEAVFAWRAGQAVAAIWADESAGIWGSISRQEPEILCRALVARSRGEPLNADLIAGAGAIRALGLRMQSLALLGRLDLAERALREEPARFSGAVRSMRREVLSIQECIPTSGEGSK